MPLYIPTVSTFIRITDTVTRSRATKWTRSYTFKIKNQLKCQGASIYHVVRGGGFMICPWMPTRPGEGSQNDHVVRWTEKCAIYFVSDQIMVAWVLHLSSYMTNFYDQKCVKIFRIKIAPPSDLVINERHKRRIWLDVKGFLWLFLKLLKSTTFSKKTQEQLIFKINAQKLHSGVINNTAAWKKFFCLDFVICFKTRTQEHVV